MIDKRRAQVSKLILGISDQFQARDFATWAKMHPEEIDRYWSAWDDLDKACLNYLAWEPVTWESVMDAARDLYGIPL